MSEFKPLSHVCFVVAVHIKNLTVAGDGFKTAGAGLTEFADIGKTGCFVDKDTGVSVTHGTAADEENIVQMVDRMQMVACDIQGTVNVAAVALPVGGDIDFFEGAGIDNHAVLHVPTGDNQGGIVIGILCVFEV